MRTLLLIILSLMASIVFAQNTRTDHWQSDLKMYKNELQKRHIDLYNKIDSQNFENQWQQIYNALDELTDWQVAVELMRLTRKIGDGHTSVSVRDWETHYFPIGVKKISGKWRVVQTSDLYPEILGATLEKIDGTNISVIEKELSAVVQYVENKHSETVRIGEYLPLSELLNALKITDAQENANFQFVPDKGKKQDVVLKAVPKNELDKINYKNITIGVPQVIKPEKQEFEYLWFTQIANTQATYIRFDSYPTFEEMLPFAEKLVGFMMQNQSRQIVIDMRNNGGGDLYIGLILANALNMLDYVDWKNGVYVLSSGITFSAGASNVALFRELLNAKVVGTPTGSNPTGYQDMDEFILPNSKLRITYSKRLFRIQETATEGVQPDIFIDYQWESYVQGKDNILEQIIQIISKK